MTFGRGVVLPIDELKLRRKYKGNDFHRIMIEKQRFIFVKARNRISKKKWKEGINKKRSKVEFEVGDPVFYKANVRQDKLDQRWRLYCLIIEETGSVIFKVWDQ